MREEIRIPTLIALAILTIGTVAGVFLASQKQFFNSRASVSAQPKNITIANVSSRSFSVYWTTDIPETGFLQSGVTSSLLDKNTLDERDQDAPKKHQLHFITVNNLYPGTTYFFKVYSGAEAFPKSEILEVRTSSLDVETKNYPAITGNVLDSNLSPIDEAIITLEIPGAQPRATITKLSGSFNISLSDLKIENLSQGFEIVGPDLFAKLKAFNNSLNSTVNLSLPLQKPNLPAIVLGENRDLAAPSPTPNYDINADNALNQLDHSALITLIQTTKYKTEADLNKDGKVDQKDLEILDSVIASKRSPETSPTKAPTPAPR